MDVLSVIMIFIVTPAGCTVHVMYKMKKSSVSYSVVNNMVYSVQHIEDKMCVHHTVHIHRA